MSTMSDFVFCLTLAAARLKSFSAFNVGTNILSAQIVQSRTVISKSRSSTLIIPPPSPCVFLANPSILDCRITFTVTYIAASTDGNIVLANFLWPRISYHVLPRLRLCLAAAINKCIRRSREGKSVRWTRPLTVSARALQQPGGRDNPLGERERPKRQAMCTSNPQTRSRSPLDTVWLDVRRVDGRCERPMSFGFGLTDSKRHGVGHDHTSSCYVTLSLPLQISAERRRPIVYSRR